MGELKKIKHNHLLTTLLKNIIFAVVMLAPFFAVLSRCMYVTFNKNAKDSYSLLQNNEYQLVDNQVTLKNNYMYMFTNNRDVYNTTSLQRVYCTNFVAISGFTNGDIPNNVTYFRVYYNSNNQVYTLHLHGDTDNYPSLGTYANPSNKQFTFESTSEQTNTNYLTNIQLIQFGTQNTLDNAFEYSVNQLNEMQIFNWTTNTAIYTPINSMCSDLGFTQNDNVIALLLTYWAINTAIYIIFDIVIACFTKLTHFMSSD